jgi:hypothetical protein
MKPLLGSVQSTLYIYRRKKDDDKDDDPAIVHRSTRTDHGLVQQDIYCHFEAEIYPNNPKKEINLPWKDILNEDIPKPKAFTVDDLEKDFHINLEQYHHSIEKAIEKQITDNATRRAAAILKRRDAIPRYPSHAEQKKGSGPNMLEGQAADGPYVPSDDTSSSDDSSEVSTSPPRKRTKV